MAAKLPVLRTRDLSRTKNKKAIDEVVPFVYETVIAWGCDKGEHESFIDYYDRRSDKLWNDNKEEWEKEVEGKLENLPNTWSEESKRKQKEKLLTKVKQDNLKKLLVKETWTEGEKNHLATEKCQGFDATLLHKLVPTICDGIVRYDPKAPSSTQIEKFLREIKNLRNYVYHDPHRASVSDTILNDLEVSAVNVFNAAGVLYASSLDQKIVQEKIAELKEKLDKIRKEEMIDEQQRIIQTAKKMTEDGMAEMEKAVLQQATDYLPYRDGKFTRTDIYHDVNLSMEVENGNADAELPKDKKAVEFRSSEILQKSDGDVILCEGEPGSGKSTLLRRLREDYFAGKKMFTGLDIFQLILFMDCRDNTLTSILQLLRKIFPKTMNQLNDDEALRALHELKLLICINGLDELNRNSRKLLDELISTFQLHGDATFVCTSRPGQAHTLRSVKYKTMTLLPVTQEEEQIAFLERYQANIDGIVAPELIRAFKSLVQSCKDCLRQPIYLALFCDLFRKFGQKVCLWKNELSIMKHILALSEQTMIERMTKTNFEIPEDYAENVTEAITQLSVQLVRRGEVTIDKNTYTELRRKIFGQAEVPHYSIMSSYFTRHADGQSFNLYHKHYLEFLAAKQLYKFLVSNPSAPIISALMSDAPTTAFDVAPAPVFADGEDVPVKQFDNVFRFLTMMLAEGGPAMKEALKCCSKEVFPALAREQIGFNYWVEITISCHDSDIIAEAAAMAAKTVSDRATSPEQRKWQVTTRKDMRAVTRMLPYHQPVWLGIRPLRSEGIPVELKPLLEAVAVEHTGMLDLFLNESYDSFSGIDDLIIGLKSGRFALRLFRACIGPSREVRQVLVAAIRRAERAGVLPDLAIALTDPRQHQLDALEGTRHLLSVMAQLKPSEAGQRCPLPRGSERPPLLIVNSSLVTGDAVKKTASLIEDLAPKDRQYYVVYLQNWPGTDDALDELVQDLSAAGVKTDHTGSPRWCPSGFYANGDCITCQESSHRPGERCVQLVLP